MFRAVACAIPAVAIFAGCASPRDEGVLPYPASRTVNAVDDYHGTTVTDPYRWLEDLESQEVRDWAAAQRRLVRAQVDRGGLREAIRQRLGELADPFIAFWNENSSTSSAGTEFRLQPAESGNGNVLVVASPSKPERVLVGRSKIGASKQLSWFRPSPDGKLVAYALSEGGSEWVETRICNAETDEDLPELLSGMLFEQPIWTKDGKGFFYVRCQRPPAGESVMYRDPEVYFHLAGTPQDQDLLIYGTAAGTVDVSLELGMSDDGRYVFIYEGGRAHHGQIGWSRTRMFHLDLKNPASPDLSAQPVALTETRDAAYKVIATSGTTAYVFTDRDAPRRRVVAIDLSSPGVGSWRDVIPQREGVLQEVHHFGGRLVGVYLESVVAALRVYALDGADLGGIPLPGLGSAYEFTGSHEEPEFTFAFESFLTPTHVWRHDLRTAQTSLVRKVRLDFRFEDFEMRQLWFSSPDGTRVPVFVVHRRGISLDGSHPTMLYGYGSSGDVVTPMLWPEMLCWLEMGGVFAIANPRGGGELGVDWHEAAVLERKQTTFDDFIAAAEFLISEGYTSPERLAITGTSYGGLLVSAVMTQRPELFAAVIPRVPAALDRLRFEPGRHVEQYGSARDPELFPALFAYSPLHRIREGTCYPATLIVTSLNDERAPAWHAMKFAAALQAAQACRRPILLRAEAEGGHAAATSPEDWKELTADELSFAARHTGLRREKHDR